MIKVYANKLVDCVPEIYSCEHPISVLDWFRRDGLPDDIDLDSFPVSVFLNDRRLLPGEWESTFFGPSDEVEIFCEPKGTDPFSITFALIFGAKAVLSALMPKMPGLPNSSRGAGDALQEASAKGNKVKLNSIIRESFGYQLIYPDYLITPRRYFRGPREQWVEMLLCVGRGEYDIPLGRIKTGETPLISLGDAADFNIYDPGVYLGGEEASKFWFQAPEVGAGSTGRPGLDLTVSTDLTVSSSASVYEFNDDTISVPVGGGAFPADWTDGLIIRVIAPYAYTVLDGTGDDGRDIIQGDIAQLGLSPGDSIEIMGNNSGTYTVHSASATELELDYPGGAPGTGLTIGSTVSAIGPVGLRFRILAFSTSLMEVERLTSTGSVDTGWPGWTLSQTNQGFITLDVSNLQGGYRGPFAGCPEGTLATSIEWDVFFPSGLVGLGREGQQYLISSEHVFEYRDMATAGPWTELTKSVSGDSLDAQGFTFRQDLPYPMRPECRIKRLPTSVGRQEEAQDDSMWYGLRCLLPSPSSYEGVTVMAVYVRGGDRISSQSESLMSCEATRILPQRVGGFWTPPAPTRQIAAAFGYIAKSVGYTDADIDLVELDRLQAIWDSRGDTYDRKFTEATTVKAALIECLQAGFGELTLDRGLLVPVRDEIRGPEFNHVYNPQVMREPMKREFTAPDNPDDYDGVNVEYLDANTWQVETVECRLPGDLGQRAATLKLDGVINRTRAWRIGMRLRRSYVYRQKTYTFSTELDALNSGYLDYVALGDNVPGYAQSGFLIGCIPDGTGWIIGTSEKLDWTEAGEYRALIRRRDGTASGPYVASPVSDFSFRIPSLDFTPDLSWESEPPFYQFGPVSRWVYPALITDINPSGTKSCNVTAVNYDVRMYADDDNSPPN